MIYVIGIGSAGASSLGTKAIKAISNAGLLAGGSRHLELFKGVAAQRVVIKGGLDHLSSSIGAYLARRPKKCVAVIATGDPLLFGIAGSLIKKFGRKDVIVIPNVSVVQEALALIKETANGLQVLSGHGRGADLTALCEGIVSSTKTAVFTDEENTPARISKALIKMGASGFKVYVAESIGLSGERVVSGTLEKIASTARFAPLNVMILIKEEAPVKAAAHIPGIPDSRFAHSNGMITKQEYRVVSLSRLAIARDSVVWDIGSGCGSVAIEAALIASLGRVYAVEKEKKRVRDIEKNAVLFGVKNIEVINGTAPGCMKSMRLCSPDGIFIGGGGTGIREILAFCSSKIKKGGNVVVNAVTMETAGSAFEFFKAKGWERDLVLMNLSKARDLNGLNMLGASNPVFIITGTRPRT
ncbi:MAG: precorrin-6y C5,15-methyltransferase (decarboxylating) subunit CbiE [Deltaproteobacteria bacterium]